LTYWSLSGSISCEVRNSGEPRIDLDHRLAPASTSPGWGLSLYGREVASSPSGLREKGPAQSHTKRTFLPRLFATCCPQQKIFQDKFTVVGIKRRTAGAAGELSIGDRFRSSLYFDELIKRVTVRAKARWFTWHNASHINWAVHRIPTPPFSPPFIVLV
jgi:hypothetical protein